MPRDLNEKWTGVTANSDPDTLPHAADDTLTGVSEDTTGTAAYEIPVSALLANDEGGAAKTLYSVESLSAALVTISPDGTTIFYDTNGAFDYLADGETATDTWEYTIRLANGALSTARVTLTITGNNDGPVIDATASTLTGAIGELAEGAAGEGVAMHSASGAVAYSDLDLSDTHTASVLPQGDSYRGTFTLGAAADGSLAWSLEVDDATIEDLAEGQTLTQSYDVTVDDGNGGTATETVVVTITGSNDAVVITAEDLAGAVVEDAADPTLSDSGAIGFEDVDLTDVHGASAAFKESTHTSQLGALTAAVTTDTTGSGTGGVVTWNFAVDDSAVQFLGAGDMITETYTVTLTDNEGSTVERGVAVTLTGSNDAALIGGQTTGEVTEDTVTSTSGTLIVSDVDAGEAAFQSETIGSTYGSLNINAAGNWTYFLNNGLAAVQALNDGQSLSDTVTVQTIDGTTQDIGITIIGVSEANTGPTDDYSVTALVGTFQWGFTDWNASSSFGNLNNSTARGDVTRILTDGYTFSRQGDVGRSFSEVNGIYDAASSFNQIELTFDDGPTLVETFDFISSRAYGNNNIAIRGVTEAGATVTLGSSSSAVLGVATGPAGAYRIDVADTVVTKILVEYSGNQLSFHEIAFNKSLRSVVFGATDPIVLDLDGGGVRLDGSISFDIDADGAPEMIGWANRNDGVLVMDIDGSGAIENGTEVLSEVFNGFGFGSSMEALRSLDSNLDGKVDAEDDTFAEIMVWRDQNGDGVSQPGDLMSLTGLGIESISVEEQVVDRAVDGQSVFAEGVFVFDNGQTGAYAGVDFGEPTRSGDGQQIHITPDGTGPQAIGAFTSGSDQLVFNADYAGESLDVTANLVLTEGAAAVGTGAQFVYDQASAKLSWDADGEGGVDAVALATFDANTALSIDDFMFI